MTSKLLRCLRLEKMIWRWGKSGVISNVELGMLLILQCVVLASFLSTTVASPAPSPVPSPPFCSRSLVTTIWSALLALISLMIDAWGQASAQVAFKKRDRTHFWNARNLWRKVLWTIVLALNPIVGTFYVLQTMFVTCKFRKILGMEGMKDGDHTRKIAKAIADAWVAVRVAERDTIPSDYNLNWKQGDKDRYPQANPDPKLVLNLARTDYPADSAKGRSEDHPHPLSGLSRLVELEARPTDEPEPEIASAPAEVTSDPEMDRQSPTATDFYCFLLNYEGMLALLRSGALADADYQQLRFLGRRKVVETGIIFLQSMSYIIAVVYRRIQHLKVTPIEGIGFACSLLFLVHAFVQCTFGSRSKQGLLIHLTPTQEVRIQKYWTERKKETRGADGIRQQEIRWADGVDPNCCAFFWTFVVGLVVAGVATVLVLPVLGTKKKVDMPGHIIFFGDFLLQFFFFILYFKKCLGAERYPNLFLTLLLFTGIIASVGVALASYATKRHWHDQGFDKPTPSLGRYFPFIR